VCCRECVGLPIKHKRLKVSYSTKPAPSYIAGSTLEDVPPNLPNLYVGVCVCVQCVCVCMNVCVRVCAVL